MLLFSSAASRPRAAESMFRIFFLCLLQIDEYFYVEQFQGPISQKYNYYFSQLLIEFSIRKSCGKITFNSFPWLSILERHFQTEFRNLKEIHADAMSIFKIFSHQKNIFNFFSRNFRKSSRNSDFCEIWISNICSIGISDIKDIFSAVFGSI